MNIERHESIEKDLRDLRRFPTPEESLGSWERLFVLKGLKETPGIEPYPGFGMRKIYKARVVPLKENLGKLKGYRAIFEIKENKNCCILVFSRHGIYKTEGELIKTIKIRLNS